MRASGDDLPRPRSHLTESSHGVSRGGADSGLARNPGLRSYLRFLGTFKGTLVLVMACFGVSSGALAVLPIFVGELVQSLPSASGATSSTYRYAVIIIGCNILHDLTWRAGELLYRQLLTHRCYEYENLLFRDVIDQRYPYFVGKFTGKISSYIATLGREFRDILDAACFTYVEQVIRVPSVVAIMFAVNLWSGLTFLAAVLLMMLVGRHTASLSFRAEKGLADQVSELDGHVIDVIANFVSVKSFRQEVVEYREVCRRRRDVIDAARRSALWDIVFWTSMSIIVRYLVWPTSILLNLHLYLTGQLSLAQFATFLSVLVMFSDFIQVTVWEIGQLNLRLARAEEAYRYLFGGQTDSADHSPPARGEAADAAASTLPGRATGPGLLELRALLFAYPDDRARPVLSGIDLKIEPGEKIGVVGRSGSGKTTLVKLLLGYYPLPAGMVLVEGRPTPNDQLAAGISYVPQDTALFHRSIRENITYGAAAEVSQEQVEAAALRAHAHDFIIKAPAGYDTLVGERGIRLSTGQRQRIAIARAFLDDKPILILDEATSALDSESEVLVQHALEQLWSGKTVIAVAHRLSTLLTMDRIIVLAGGKIVEQGSHRELLDLGGRYRALWERQSGGMIAMD
ncbi:ABC transporter ATP-binding protein [Frankia sp. AgKG'84/4]|uniref:ABC transporter ATP-binding protein n=1 Tax=Frankia sp. AgKG'84/4 TaxID=573490 RepID=UPI00200D81BC|nr:ABC transporter ATP-binding protein [Frankia sp. AgKG'84/4]MCL9795986.1 ABC transporter ATP-binding protein/permease [Frankia sp. AgKG'84/4]